jgi:hypothetical protein
MIGCKRRDVGQYGPGPFEVVGARAMTSSQEAYVAGPVRRADYGGCINAYLALDTGCEEESMTRLLRRYIQILANRSVVQPAHDQVLQQILKALWTVGGHLDAHVLCWRNNVQTKNARGEERDSVRKPCAEEAEGGREEFVVR